MQLLPIITPPILSSHIYRHFKGGIYTVFGVAEPPTETHRFVADNNAREAIHTESLESLYYKTVCANGIMKLIHNSESGESLVLYRDAEHANKMNVWARPLESFNSEVDGVPRFQRLDGHPLVTILDLPLMIPHQWLVSRQGEEMLHPLMVFSQYAKQDAIEYARLMKLSTQAEFRVEPIPYTPPSPPCPS